MEYDINQFISLDHFDLPHSKPRSSCMPFCLGKFGTRRNGHIQALTLQNQVPLLSNKLLKSLNRNLQQILHRLANLLIGRIRQDLQVPQSLHMIPERVLPISLGLRQISLSFLRLTLYRRPLHQTDNLLMFVLNHPPNEPSDEQRSELALVLEFRNERLLNLTAFIDLHLVAFGCGVSRSRRWDGCEEEAIPVRFGCLLACLGAVSRLEWVQRGGDRLRSLCSA